MNEASCFCHVHESDLCIWRLGDELTYGDHVKLDIGIKFHPFSQCVCGLFYVVIFQRFHHLYRHGILVGKQSWRINS